MRIQRENSPTSEGLCGDRKDLRWKEESELG